MVITCALFQCLWYIGVAYLLAIRSVVIGNRQ